MRPTVCPPGIHGGGGGVRRPPFSNLVARAWPTKSYKSAMRQYGEQAHCQCHRRSVAVINARGNVEARRPETQRDVDAAIAS